jgi:hypothetical protein
VVDMSNIGPNNLLVLYTSYSTISNHVRSSLYSKQFSVFPMSRWILLLRTVAMKVIGGHESEDSGHGSQGGSNGSLR